MTDEFLIRMLLRFDNLSPRMEDIVGHIAACVQEGRRVTISCLSNEHTTGMDAATIEDVQLPHRGQAIVLPSAAVVELQAVAKFETLRRSGPVNGADRIGVCGIACRIENRSLLREFAHRAGRTGAIGQEGVSELRVIAKV